MNPDPEMINKILRSMNLETMVSQMIGKFSEVMMPSGPEKLVEDNLSKAISKIKAKNPESRWTVEDAKKITEDIRQIIVGSEMQSWVLDIMENYVESLLREDNIFYVYKQAGRSPPEWFLEKHFGIKVEDCEECDCGDDDGDCGDDGGVCTIDGVCMIDSESTVEDRISTIASHYTSSDEDEEADEDEDDSILLKGCEDK